MSPILYSGDFELPKIVNWMQTSSLPLVIEFGDDYIEPIFGEKKPALFLLRSNEKKEANYVKVFEEAAK